MSACSLLGCQVELTVQGPRHQCMMTSVSTQRQLPDCHIQKWRGASLHSQLNKVTWLAVGGR